MKSDALLVVFLLALALILGWAILDQAVPDESTDCEPPSWPKNWPPPDVTIDHTTGWVCQYGEPPEGERYGWATCVRWTKRYGCESFEGTNLRGDRL